MVIPLVREDCVRTVWITLPRTQCKAIGLVKGVKVVTAIKAALKGVKHLQEQGGRMARQHPFNLLDPAFGFRTCLYWRMVFVVSLIRAW